VENNEGRIKANRGSSQVIDARELIEST
jgi:hypothetical protein